MYKNFSATPAETPPPPPPLVFSALTHHTHISIHTRIDRNCHQTLPVFGDQICMANGMAFSKERFHCEFE